MSSSQVTIYSRRLRSAQRQKVCQCKVGSCQICGSKCRRCMCACDGVEPADALARSRGGYRRKVNSIKKASEKKKHNSKKDTKRKHFHKVGKLRESTVIDRKRKRWKCVNEDTSNIDDKDNDPDYVETESATATFTSTIQTESITMKRKAPNRQHVTKTSKKKNSTKTPTATNIEKDDMETVTEVNDEEDFEMQIEGTHDNSIFEDEEVVSTIAEQIMRGNKELPPKEHRFVMTNMEEVNKEMHCDDTIITQPTVQNKYTKTGSLLALLQKLDLPSHWIRVIPSFYVREHAKDIKAVSSKQSYGRLLSLGNRMFISCMKQLCPGPGCHEFQSTILSRMTSQVERTNQKLQKEQQRMIQKDLKEPNNPYKRTASEKLDSVVSTLCSWSNKSVKRSLERRVLRAVLNESFLRHEIVDMKKNYNLKQGNGQPVEQARNDAKTLRLGNKLNLSTITRQFKDDLTIIKCVDFVLSDKNVSSVAWGTKVLLSQSVGEVTLPKLTRKTPIFNMYNSYVDFTAQDKEKLKIATFYKICNALTASDEAMLSSVDYVAGLLVNETCETLQDMIERIIPNEHREDCTKLVSVSRNFMKNQFKDIVTKTDDCCFHGIDYALSRNMPLRENTNDNGCKFPFYTCEYIKDILLKMQIESERECLRDDAISVIDGIKEKFKYYLAHQTRCKCQSLAISFEEEKIKKICVESKGKVVNAIMILDFKMKFETKSSRETTVEHYGKRGIGWHGFAIIFYLLDDEGKPYRNIVYLDQILTDTNKQDGLMVVALLELAITTIVNELPFINKAIITSDNATCYQNHFVTFMIGIYNQRFNGKFFIESFIHSETQDGKSLLDAHFATSNRHLLVFMKTWRTNRVTRINTARGLSFALSFNLGLKNSMIQLVDVNHTRLENIRLVFDKLIKECSDYYSRANCIKFHKPFCNEVWEHFNNDETHDYFIDQIKKTSFSFSVMAYSNIDPEVEFYVDVNEQTLSINEEASNLILSILERDESTNFNGTSADAEHNVTLDMNDVQDTFTTNKTSLPPNNENDDGIVTMSDFSVFRSSKKSCIDKLDRIGAFSLLSMSSKTIETEPSEVDGSASDDSDSDYDYEEDSLNINEDDDLEDLFLSTDESNSYGKPPDSVFHLDKMITGTRLVQWLPLGAIRRKKNSTKVRKISSKKMIKGVVDKAITYAQNHIQSNNLFLNRTKLDPIMERASNFRMDPFENGWAKRRGHGNLYGISYIHLYEDDLKTMFQAGVINNSNKMSAGKMRENLLDIYPDRFSIPGETEIKQFIGKLSQQSKKKGGNDASSAVKSTRGRKAGNITASWHGTLREIVNREPNERPEEIFRILMATFDTR